MIDTLGPTPAHVERYGMSTLDDLFNSLPLQGIAERLGVNADDVSKAVQSVLPALVGGMQANAADPAGASSLAEALAQHDNDLASGDIDLDAINTEDGAKIVRHVFGQNEDAVVQRLSGAQGFSGGLLTKLLPMLAPLVMSWLAKRIFGGGKKPAPAPAPQQESEGGGLGGLWDKITGKDKQPAPQSQVQQQQAPSGLPKQAPAGSQQADEGFIDDLLDKVRGPQSQQPQAQRRTQQSGPGGIDLGSILGDLLGGGGKSGGGGMGGIDIGSILGDLLGAGRR